jgi:hypothetical protein
MKPARLRWENPGDDSFAQAFGAMRAIYAGPITGSRSNTFNQAVWNSGATKSTTASKKGLPVARQAFQG